MDSTLSLINKKSMLRKMEQEHKNEIMKELHQRNKIVNENDQRILQNLKDNLERSAQNQKAKSEMFEKEISRQISDANKDSQCLDYAEKLKQAHQLKLKKFAQIKDELKIREQNLKQQSNLFDKYKMLFCASMDKFTKIFQKLTPESKQKLSSHKTAALDLIKQFDKINAAEQFNSTELELVDKICKNLEKINQDLVDEEARAAEESKKLAELQEQEKQRAEQEQAAQDAVDHQKVLEGQLVSCEDAFRRYGTEDNLKCYVSLKAFYKEQTDALKLLEKDPNMEKIRFRFKKAINVPVNAIASVSAAHFTDKYDRLFNLLIGKPVQVDNDQVVASDPVINTYCKQLLAKKFLHQGDQVVSSHPESAFPLAAIIVALWQKFPDFGQLLLTQFYMECPYLIPIYLPEDENSDKIEHLKSLGYRFNDDNQIEDESNYLKRIAGFGRLYFAIMITKSRRNVTDPNPFPIENGWIWLCNILNLDPFLPKLMEVYCTLIIEFLQIAGSMLQKCYGNQFFKIMRTIKNQYLVLMKTNCGPKSRLEQTVDDILMSGSVQPPKGILSANFW